MKYSVMKNPCTIVEEDSLWCIVGQSEKYGSGVLAWCHSEEIAKHWYEIMENDPDFTKISYEKWKR